MVALELLLVAAFTVATRLPFLLVPSSDRATQLWMIKVYARNGRIAPLRFDDSLRSGRLGYPPLPLSILARLPERTWAPAAASLNLSCDVLHAGLVYASICTVGAPNAWLFAALYTSLPLLHPVNARLVGFGARTLAPLLCTLYTLTLVALASAPWLAFPAAVALGVLTILSSQFGLQYLLVVSVGVAVWTATPGPLLALAVAFGAGWLMPGVDIPVSCARSLVTLAGIWRHGICT